MITVDIALRRGAFALEIATTIEDGALGVFGPSGAGKTTLLHLIAGLLRPDRGRIVIAGETVVDTATGIWVPPHRRRIGVVFQDGWLFPHLSVESNLRYGERLRPINERRFTFDRIVDLLRLRPFLRRRPAALSSGERRRVAIGRAILASPRVLLCDEPLTGLDRALQRDILPFLAEVRDTLGLPLLYVSHDLGEILALTDRLLILDHGTIAGTGDAKTLANDPRCRELLIDHKVLNSLPLNVPE